MMLIGDLIKEGMRWVRVNFHADPCRFEAVTVDGRTIKLDCEAFRGAAQYLGGYWYYDHSGWLWISLRDKPEPSHEATLKELFGR
jgi:hypothetical protein